MKPLISRASIVHIHRAVALLSIVLILFVALSGLLLQHAEDLGWHKKHIDQPWQFQLYNVPPARPIAWHISNTTGQQAIQLAYQWYLNGTLVNDQDRQLKGAVRLNSLWVLADNSTLFLFDEQQQFLEQIPLDFAINKAGVNQQQQLVIQSGKHFYLADQELINFEATANKQKIDWSVIEPLQTALQQTLPKKVSNISYMKLIQDLHGGRLWGLPHWLIPDMTALALIFLSLSGLMMKWQRRPRKKKKPVSRRTA